MCAVCWGFVYELPLFVRAIAPRIASGIRPDFSLTEDNMKLNVEAGWHAIQPLLVLIKL